MRKRNLFFIWSTQVLRMRWLKPVSAAIALMGCAHPVKEAGAAVPESTTNVRASEVAVDAAMRRRWSDKIFTTTERTKDGWRVFVEEADGRKRKAFVRVDGSGEVVEFRTVRE